ncbi:hypothetical protein [Flavobacterium silvaticum]|uniref:Uncharacterized protein n=1 Tax=Flavobacterium silvaticum TaxID=1852020 RepID=A0A972FNX7_9FLAO|nr:hypothetical protein [Flavobacterium silvaticum]NMH29544.1 hypothetical protein [Flavobacterium silvaticum]
MLKYNYQIALVIIGLAVIALLDELFQLRNQHIIFPDSDNYREAGEFLYHHFKPHYYRPFGMALIFGLPYLLGFGDAAVYDFSFWVNVSAWIASALLIFSFCRKRLPDSKAFIVSVLFYGLISPALINFHLLTESIFVFLMFSAMTFLDDYFRIKSFRLLSLALAILIFTALIKPGMFFFSLLVLAFFSRSILRHLSKPASGFIFFSIVLLVFQMIQMKREYGNFTISYIDGVTYYNYLGSKAEAFEKNQDPIAAIRQRSDYIFGFSYPQQKIIARKDLHRQINHNTPNLIKAYFSNIVYNATCGGDFSYVRSPNTRFSELIKTNAGRFSKYQNIFLTVLGIFLSVTFLLKTFRKPTVYSFISVFILYIIAVSGVSYYQADRFHMVIFPFVLVLAVALYSGRLHQSKNQPS